MRIKEVKQGALAALKNRWGFAVLLTFVTYLIAAGIPGLIDFLITIFPNHTPAAKFITSLVR